MLSGGAGGRPPGQADGSPKTPWSSKTVRELGAPSAVPSVTRTVTGATRARMQGRDMEQITVGVDVAKKRLDVHVHPQGETFAVAADETGVQELVRRLQRRGPRLGVVRGDAAGGSAPPA